MDAKVFGLEKTFQNQFQGQPGFNVIGCISGNLGIGVTARNIVHLLRERDCSVATFDIDPGSNRGKYDLSFAQYEVKALDELPYAINLIVLPPDFLSEFLNKPSLILGRCRLNVGFSPWELAVLPKAWSGWLQLLDVVVAESDFIRYTFERHLSGVATISAPHPIFIPDGIQPSRSRFGLPEDAVLFINSFEPHSDPRRKNPFAVIDAFRHAFDHDERAHLIIKLNNARVDGQAHPIVSELRDRAGANPRIHLFEETLSYSEVLSLYASCDAYVSLHRAEGLGLGLMEAMALGKPVIATAWSGNMSYMNHTNSCLVSYKLIPVDGDHSAYKKELFGGDAFWADACTEEAAAWMKKLVDDPGLRISIGKRAATDMARYQEKAKQGTFIDELQQIWQHRIFLPEPFEREKLTERWLRNLENELDALKGHARALEQERDSLKDHASNLENELDALKGHARVLEQERDSLKDQASNLELEGNTLRQHASNLQSELEESRQHASSLQSELEESRHCASKIGEELAAIRVSRSWRWTAPARDVFDRLLGLSGSSRPKVSRQGKGHD